jgi:ABC-type transporter Mla maintaining outer membrane lipid asymmetry ATPase subunit MlaF
MEVQAILAYNACMQYTLRKIPKQLDAEVRRRAHEERKSMNRTLLEALARGVGLQGEAQRQRDLSDIAGTWKKDVAFDRAIAEQDEVDEALWK